MLNGDNAISYVSFKNKNWYAFMLWVKNHTVCKYKMWK